jgi:hypothetical protein
MAILCVRDICALDAADRSALTGRRDLLFMDSYALCLYDTRCVWYDTRCVVIYVRVRPQEMTSDDVMTGRLLCSEGGVVPRGVAYLNCTKAALRLQSQLGLQSKTVHSSRLVNPLFTSIKSLSTCAEQVTLVLTSSHGPLEP